MEITIRKAVLADLSILDSFQQGVVEAERPFDPTLKKGALIYYDIQKLINSEESELLVAVVDNQVVGSGYARIEKAKGYLKHEHHGYLGFMFVLPDFRQKGVNKLILDGLKDWCFSKEVYELRLEVYPQNAGAIRAYEKAGFEGIMLEMRMNLKD